MINQQKLFLIVLMVFFVGNFGYILPIHIFTFYIQEYIEYKNAPLLLQIPIKNALDQKEEYGNLW